MFNYLLVKKINKYKDLLENGLIKVIVGMLRRLETRKLGGCDAPHLWLYIRASPTC